MCVWFIKHHGPGPYSHFIVNIAHFIVKGHRSGLAGLMVLKGIVFRLFLPFFHQDGLEGLSRHDIWASSELCSFCRLCCWGPGSCRIIHILSISVTVPVVHLMGPVPCLLWKNWTFSLTLRGCRSLALWALSNCSFCFSWSSTSLCQI